jgi:SAM-dependent methyltransferase
MNSNEGIESISKCPVCHATPGDTRIDGFHPCGCGTHFKPEYRTTTIEDFGPKWLKEREKLNREMRKRARDKLERVLSVSDGRGRLLEIGCGPGELLAVASDMGLEAVGVDANSSVIDYCRNNPDLDDVDLHQGELQEIDLKKDSFDFIVMSHLIEHVPDPSSLLQSVNELLKPSGVGYIGTPNAASYAEGPIRSQFGGHMSLDHKVIYSPDSLVQLLSNEGFRQIRTDTSIAKTDVLFSVKTFMLRATGLKSSYQQKRVETFSDDTAEHDKNGFIDLARNADYMFRRFGYVTQDLWGIVFSPYHLWLAAQNSLPMLHCTFKTDVN